MNVNHTTGVEAWGTFRMQRRSGHAAMSEFKPNSSSTTSGQSLQLKNPAFHIAISSFSLSKQLPTAILFAILQVSRARRFQPQLWIVSDASGYPRMNSNTINNIPKRVLGAKNTSNSDV
ncbi:hypothetical protein M408DRAFT_243007 [Serendipita vermifera MAFF 305830]|uniref:Uncharacterized protein n=1 Tax=Serendipita vermifera MAFF 305830 TaxID=933852 RepID=A0A0C2X4E1_SERVB|nr:hypothetical protein M408DRAFT_243007 [Serendipita vermifera MAFF 305830]